MSLRQSFNRLFHSKVNPTTDSTTSETYSPPPSSSPLEQKVHPTLDDSIVEDSKVRIGLEPNLFSHTGNAIPIVTTRSGNEAFHNLQVRGQVFTGNDVVLEDRDTHKVMAVVERHYETAGNVFTIFSAIPAYTDGGQRRANLFKYNQDMYTFAQVKQGEGEGKQAWDVVLEGDGHPTYVIHKIVPHTSRRFPTTHVIKKHGTEVASTRYHHGGGQEKSFILTVDAGVDPTLMICLAIIADEADKATQ